MGPKRGIIILTLVISRVSLSPTNSTWGFCIMRLNIFRVKTKLELQIEEYLTWKVRNAPLLSVRQGEILRTFGEKFKYKSVEEIKIEDVKKFFTEILNFVPGQRMKALREFLRFHKRIHDIDFNVIGDNGVFLQVVAQSVIIPTMKIRKFGRPYKDVDLIKAVKKLRDTQLDAKGKKLTYDVIGRIVKKGQVIDRSQVYRMYKYSEEKLKLY